MVGKRSGGIVQHLIDQMLTDLVREDVKATMPATPSSRVPVCVRSSNDERAHHVVLLVLEDVAVPTTPKRNTK
jgi:hypothetical protein